jgi:DNA polymerase delta subunit 3
MKEEEEEATEEEEGEDVPMSDYDERESVFKKPRKKAVKKVVPLGGNGLKKKRVVKKRTITDDKGYMGSCDVHSSYGYAAVALKPPSLQ